MGLLGGLAGIVEPDGDGAVVHVHVQPRAGRTQLVGRHGEALKVRVTAPPVDGRANEAAIGLLSATLGVPASRIALVSGAHSRLKRFRIAGLSAATVTLRIEAALSDTGTV